MKKIINIFLLLLILSLTLYANIKVKIDKEEVYSGNEVRYTIIAIGQNPVFPDIRKISGYDVVKITSKTGITNDYKEIASQSYIF